MKPWFIALGTLCLVGILFALGNNRHFIADNNGELYAEIGPVYSFVYYNGVRTVVTIDKYALPTNGTAGSWGGPWFTKTAFHSSMVVVLATLTTALLCTAIQVGLASKKEVSPSALGMLTAVNVILFAMASAALGYAHKMTINGNDLQVSWGVIGVVSAYAFQFFIAVLLICR